MIGRSLGSWLARRSSWWAVLAAEILLLLVPLSVVVVPPLADLPNHMARLHILALDGSDPVLNGIYRPAWRVLPNLAIDLIGTPLVAWTSIETTARLLLASEILLLLGGTIALHQAIFRVRSYWPLASGLVIYNGLFLLGLMNFGIGIGMAMLGAAALRAENTWAVRYRMPIAMLFAVVIFFCHLIALGVYFLLVAALVAGDRDWTAHGKRGRHLLAVAGAVLVPAIIPALLYGLAPRPPLDAPILWENWHGHAVSLASPFIGYHQPVDLLSLAFAVLLLAALAWRRALSLPPATALALVPLAGLSLVLPFGIANVTYLDTRFVLCAVFLVFAGMAPNGRAGGLTLAAGALAALLIVLRIGLVAEAWHQSGQDLAAFRALGAALPPGSRVLVTQVMPDEDRDAYFAGEPAARELRGLSATFAHLPAWWVIDRRVFDPMIFANPTQQPLEVLPPYDGLLAPADVAPDYRDLAPGDHPGETVATKAYLSGWEKRYDAVVVLGSGRARHLDVLDGLPLVLLGQADIATLYGVRPGTAIQLRP